MRLRADSASQPIHQGIHLALGQWQRTTVKAHKSHHARQLQNPQTVLEGNAHKDITREQRELQLFPAVLPTPHRPVQGQEARDAVPLDLLNHALFVARAGVEGVPAALVSRLPMPGPRDRMRRCYASFGYASFGY